MMKLTFSPSCLTLQVESKGSSDDEADIFPASMAGRVPGAGFSPGSGLANGKRHSLGATCS
eukprot:scaffold317009_cov17-Tisochrysis_lutea.AAC.2